MRTTRVFILLGLAFGGYVCYALVAMASKFPSVWTPLHVAIFFALFVCARGLWQSKRWAWRLSLFLAAAALGLAGYLVRFVWTFWIFEKPTLWDRILSELHPRVALFWIFPIAWLLYFSRRRVREQFL